jgi:tRNA A-37 threonylcarbamoyl transferase component Bud32
LHFFSRAVRKAAGKFRIGLSSGVGATGAGIMGEQFNRAKAIFLAAIDEQTPAQWPTFLEQACGGDARLRAEVQKLLHAQAALGSFHESPRSALVETVDHLPAERPGTVIGPYRLLHPISEGGMGVVYVAEQEKPVRRRVALKIIKPGMDSRQVLARFEAERQALALMDHPNIAKALDAGATDSGRPYFVMELVRGGPITEFCDRNRLPPEARLKLFLDVCHAIRHAHHKGVIHRDIKPANVLVTRHDGVPVVKVIDFGVAKATAQKLTERTLFTAHGQMIGTPAYVSPEQAESGGLDVDTRDREGDLKWTHPSGPKFSRRRTRPREAAVIRVLTRCRGEPAPTNPPRPGTRSGPSSPTRAASRPLSTAPASNRPS